MQPFQLSKYEKSISPKLSNRSRATYRVWQAKHVKSGMSFRLPVEKWRLLYEKWRSYVENCKLHVENRNYPQKQKLPIEKLKLLVDNKSNRSRNKENQLRILDNPTKKTSYREIEIMHLLRIKIGGRESQTAGRESQVEKEECRNSKFGIRNSEFRMVSFFLFKYKIYVAELLKT